MTLHNYVIEVIHPNGSKSYGYEEAHTAADAITQCIFSRKAKHEDVVLVKSLEDEDKK